MERIMNIVDETRALGRGEDSRRSSSLVSTTSSSSAQASEPVRFSFFERRDGSKRFYRTGRPLVAWTKLNGENQSEKTPEQHVNNFLLAINPFRAKEGVKPNNYKSKTKEKGPLAFFRR